MTDATVEGEGAGRMSKRRTTLEDGRYLIYYTFEGEGGGEGAEGSAPDVRDPVAGNEAAEERDV